jgi:hypothetical protein
VFNLPNEDADSDTATHVASGRLVSRPPESSRGARLTPWGSLQLVWRHIMKCNIVYSFDGLGYVVKGELIWCLVSDLSNRYWKIVLKFAEAQKQVWMSNKLEKSGKKPQVAT